MSSPMFFFYNDSFQSAVDTASYLFLFAACLRVPLYPVLVLDSILYPYIIIFGKLLLGYRSSISSKPTDLADHFYDTQTILFFMIPIYYRKKKKRRRRSGVKRMFFVWAWLLLLTEKSDFYSIRAPFILFYFILLDRTGGFLIFCRSFWKGIGVAKRQLETRQK